MSVFPSAPDIFTDKTGADNIASSDPNNAFDALENIENFLGASGQPQSKSVTLINAFRAMFAPLPVCSWVDADTIAILPAQAILFATNNFVIKRNTANLTCHLSTDLDTGSELANKFYELYLVGDGANTQYTAKFVLQGSSPSGLTYYKKINAFKNDSSSNLLKVFQRGTEMHYDDAHANSTVQTGALAAFTDIDCSPLVPSISRLVSFDSDQAGGVWAWRMNGSASSLGVGIGGVNGYTKTPYLPLDSVQIGEGKSAAVNINAYVASYIITEIN